MIARRIKVPDNIAPNKSELEEKQIHVSGYAKQLIDSPEFITQGNIENKNS